MAFEGYSTLKCIAEELEVSKRTIFRLESEGKIHFRRIKGKIYVKREEILKLLEESCKGCK
jgi:predicted site-specific integrase-resolvase